MLSALLIGAALVLYPIARGVYATDSYLRGVNQAFTDSSMVGLLGLLYAGILYPASVFAHRRLGWGAAWFVGWLAVALFVTAYGFLHEGLTSHYAGHGGYTVASVVVLLLGFGCITASVLTFRATQRAKRRTGEAGPVVVP